MVYSRSMQETFKVSPIHSCDTSVSHLPLPIHSGYLFSVLGPVVVIRMTLSTLTLIVPSIYQSSDPRLTLALNFKLNVNPVTAAADEECFAVNHCSAHEYVLVCFVLLLS
jgi:hypothetical protein